MTRDDGSQIVTIRDQELRVLRRTRITPDGERIVLIDDTTGAEAVDVATLPEPRARVVEAGDEQALRNALRAEADVGRRFTLGQVRRSPRCARWRRRSISTRSRSRPVRRRSRPTRRGS